MLKKFLSEKINGTKIFSFFFRELQLILVLTLICNSHLVHLSKTVCYILHSRFRSVFIKGYVLVLVTLKRHNSFQN